MPRLEIRALGAVEFEPDMAGTFTVHLEVTDGRGGLGANFSEYYPIITDARFITPPS